MKEMSMKETSSREMSVEEAFMKETSSREMSVEEVFMKETSSREMSVEEAFMVEMSVKDRFMKEMSVKEVSGKKAFRRGASMKKRPAARLLVCALLMALVTGCGRSAEGRQAGSAGMQQTGVEDVLQAGMEAEEAQNADPDTAAASENTSGKASESGRQSGLNENAPAPAQTGADSPLSSTEGVDVDLTALSSTMVYSEVYNMMASPDDYVGKTVKMKGRFMAYHAETIDQYYFACVIKDATACCSQGIEFILSDEYSFPEDYPEDGEEITVVGVFDTYMEGEYMYCTLRDAELL